MTKATIFAGGIPYGPDVRKLEAAFPVPALKEGRLIGHYELEAVLEMKRTASRYYGVVNSWLKQRKAENGIIIIWEQRSGVKVLDPAQVLETAQTRTMQKLRQTGKAIRLFHWVDRTRLDETGKQRYDHQVVMAAKIAEGIAAARRELTTTLTPIRSLPRAPLPIDKKTG